MEIDQAVLAWRVALVMGLPAAQLRDWRFADCRRKTISTVIRSV